MREGISLSWSLHLYSAALLKHAWNLRWWIKAVYGWLAQTPFQQNGHPFRAVMAAPKAKIDKREEEWQRQRGHTKKRKKAAKR
jgi:hypothetical protein